MLLSQSDFYRVANTLIRMKGKDEAYSYASKQVEILKEQGNLTGMRGWINVQNAIYELTDETVPENVVMN